MICIAKQSDFEKEQLHRFFGLPLSAKPTFSAIYNSLRYDVDAHTVTFHLREKDWKELKSNSWMWISSSYLVPVINCEDVRFGDEIVESVSRVDPVEKFGLFSVQTFTVIGFNEKDQVIKLLKVEESSFKYYAELEILDSASCKAKAMKITFQPVKCPTRVQIRFEGARGGPFNMYFSCSVDEKSSKFQISRTRGKVLCDIPKREDGTVGELVLQNPAPVPFHALTVWDARLHDIQICTKMFRTELDYELKQRDERGSPFFNLRDTIFLIFEHHIDKPKHFFPPTSPLVYCLDERGIIEKPYQTPGNMSRKKGFVIVVQQLYKWKYLPVAKVLFCDCQHFADMLRNKSEGAQMELMRSFWSASWLHLVDRIVADQQEKSLIRKMLYTNAARVPQERESDVWKNSFITLMFPREKPFDVAGAAGRFATKMKNFPFNPFFSPETSQSKESVSPESFVEFLTEFFQHQRDRSDAGPDQGSFFDPPRWAAPLREPECASCHSKTENLKRCSGCKTVFYCSKTCQKNHWKEHKPDCQSS